MLPRRSAAVRGSGHATDRRATVYHSATPHQPPHDAQTAVPPVLCLSEARARVGWCVDDIPSFVDRKWQFVDDIPSFVDAHKTPYSLLQSQIRQPCHSFVDTILASLCVFVADTPAHPQPCATLYQKPHTARPAVSLCVAAPRLSKTRAGACPHPRCPEPHTPTVEVNLYISIGFPSTKLERISRIWLCNGEYEGSAGVYKPSTSVYNPSTNWLTASTDWLTSVYKLRDTAPERGAPAAGLGEVSPPPPWASPLAEPGATGAAPLVALAAPAMPVAHTP